MKENKQKEYEREKLENELAAKMKTIMIGAIASIEEKFGALWAFRKGRPLNRQEQEFLDVFTNLRKEILDKGNNQIRGMRETLDTYDISYVGYIMDIKLPVVRNHNERV